MTPLQCERARYVLTWQPLASCLAWPSCRAVLAEKKPVAQQVAIVLKTNILIPSTKMMSGDVGTLRHI